MAISSRKLVQDTLEKAFETALQELRDRAKSLPQSLELTAVRSAEGIRACLLDQTKAPLSPSETQEAVARLIYAHADPRIVALLRTFTETVLIYLKDARQGIQGRRLDS